MALSLLLLVGLGLVTLPLWGPAAFKQGAAKFLRDAGFSEAHLSLEEIDLSGMRLAVERLSYGGVTVSDAGLRLQYDFEGLRSGALGRVTLSDPVVDVDWSHDWSPGEGGGQEEEASMAGKLPDRFPVERVDIDDAVITLRGTDGTRTVELDARLDGREQLVGELALEGEGLRIDAQVDGLWSERSARVTGTAKVEELAGLVDFGRDRGWVTLPEGFGLSSEPLEIGAGLHFAEEKLQKWHLELEGRGVAATKEPSRLSAKRLELKMRGEGEAIDQLDLKAKNGTVDHRERQLAFDRFAVTANSAEQIELRLLGWEFSGESGVDGLGTISAAAGDLKLSAEGAWQLWRPNFSSAEVGLRVQVEKAPLSLFTGLGSASGTWQMEADLSAGEARTLSLSTELLQGALTLSEASLESERLNVSVQGTLPDALEAVVGVSGGRATWSDGGGVLSGLEGEIELASLMPLASKGRQRLEFASIEQGEFAAASGQLRVNYASERGGEPPMDLEIETTALGGKVRIRIDGQIADPLDLSVRVHLDSVQLEEIAGLFPQFEGRMEGAASGELALGLEGGQIVLQPGELQLEGDTTGRFEYLRQGWLTQDPDLAPEAFVAGRDIVEIMQDPQGATVLTELAMRDLKMSDFRLEVQTGPDGGQSVVAEVKGQRTIKGVTVPVVLDVPIRGDVKETINAVFEFNTRM